MPMQSGNRRTKRNKSSLMCGLSLPMFLVVLFAVTVVCMYGYFFYAILKNRGKGSEERLVSEAPRNQEKLADMVRRRDDGEVGARLATIPDADMFHAANESPPVTVNSGEDRIWYTGSAVFMEIGCSQQQLDAMEWEIHGPVQVDAQRDVAVKPLKSGSPGFVVSYEPKVAGLYTFVINDPRKALTQEKFQRAFFHKVVDEKTYPRTHVAAAEQIRRHIYEIQNPPDCSKARLYFYNLNHGMDYGVGVNTEYMVASFGAAMAENRTFVLPTKRTRSKNIGFYWADGTCESDSWMCFFFPISKCSEADFDMSRIVHDRDSSQRPEWSTQDEGAARVVMGEACPKPMGPKAFKHLAELYAPFTKSKAKLRGQAKCVDGQMYESESLCLGETEWVAAQLTEYVFRPLPWLNKVFDEAKYSHHDWQFPLTTVHIRKTDKLKGSLKEARDPLHVYDLHNYFNAVDELTKWQVPAHVKTFIATDSDKVIAEIKSEYNEGRDLMFDDQQKRYEKGTILQLRENPGSVNQKEESVNALKDIWLLSQGSAFIGTRSSFFGRTGFLLMYASGRMESYRLLDSDPWGQFPVQSTLCF